VLSPSKQSFKPPKLTYEILQMSGYFANFWNVKPSYRGLSVDGPNLTVVSLFLYVKLENYASLVSFLGHAAFQML